MDPIADRSTSPSQRPSQPATSTLALACATALIFVLTTPLTAAVTSCGPASGQDLRQPRSIWPDDYGVLNTTLVVDFANQPCVPQWDGTNGQWVIKPVTLRNYGSPIDQDDWSKLQWTIPGPTFRVRKTYLQDDTLPLGPNNPIVEEGTRFRLLLRNQLPNNAWPAHHCQPQEVTQTKPSQTCPTPPCTFQENFPECFHGTDVTNIHYHGTHVSPQPHQDFVLLNLYSDQQIDPPPPPPDEFNQVGQYQTTMDPFPWNQAPGTHWYHPHKHGSTALQVTNGMAGTLLVHGEFDDWLYDLYGVDPDDEKQLEAFEKVLVIQQLQQELNFFNPGSPTAQPTINGQAEPVIHMRPGEIQRWRFVGATVEASAALKLGFPGFEIRQIAQDGVQFVWENYDRQPYQDPQTVTLAAPKGKRNAKAETVTFDKFTLSPGNRADFLVKAPAATGDYFVTFELRVPLADRINELFQQRVAARSGKLTALAAATGKPILLSVHVDEEAPPADMRFPVTQKDEPNCTSADPPSHCWPKTPYYLQDLAAPGGEPRKVQFSMRDPKTGICTKNAQQANSFWIDDTQYDPDCANIKMTLGSIEDWNVWNDSPLPHPFHIHINPFQVLDDPSHPDIAANGPPYPWQDTISLALGDKLSNGCNVNAKVAIRQHFEDFTGGYVIHCHFLGHEDRGMMLNVETICPNSPDPGLFGRPQNNAPDNCNQTTDALPLCEPSKYKMDHSHGSSK